MFKFLILAFALLLGTRGEESNASAGAKLFEHDSIYRITSMKDKNVIEVIISDAGSKPVQVKKWSNSPNQKFKVLLVRPGEFRVSSTADQNSSLAWDYQPEETLLMENEWQDSPNQVWTAEELHPNSKICFIRPIGDSKLCLRNMGAGKQISLVEANRKDSSQHWKLEATY